MRFMEFKALHFERKSPLDVSHTPSGDFRPIQEIFPIPWGVELRAINIHLFCTLFEG